MLRERSYWNNLPNVVTGGDDGMKVLKEWCISLWPNSKSMDYVGWQRVHLPEGWTLSLEGHDFFLLDDKNQVRGTISHVFRRAKPQKGSFSAAIAEGLAELFDESAEQKPKKRPVPTLELRTCLTKHSSFSLGDSGPYSIWVENAFGKEVFGIRNVEISKEEYEEKHAEMAKLVDGWLVANYPEWESLLAYWDAFV